MVSEPESLPEADKGKKKGKRLNASVKMDEESESNAAFKLPKEPKEEEEDQPETEEASSTLKISKKKVRPSGKKQLSDLMQPTFSLSIEVN